MLTDMPHPFSTPDRVHAMRRLSPYRSSLSLIPTFCSVSSPCRGIAHGHYFWEHFHSNHVQNISAHTRNIIACEEKTMLCVHAESEGGLDCYPQAHNYYHCSPAPTVSRSKPICHNAVPCCLNRSETKKSLQLSFFHFPYDEKVKRKWLQLIR